MINRLNILIIISTLFSLSVFAQTKVPAPSATPAASKPAVPKIIQGGVINGKALSLPKPQYPPAALAVRAEGDVNVQVLIDEQGNVISAEAVSGHPLLRSAAVTAAQNAKFSPTRLSGSPVKVSGIITYKFVRETSNEEKVKVLGVSFGLHLLKASVDDLKKFGEVFDSKNSVTEFFDEFTEFSTELAPLAKLAETPQSNRLELVNKIISSIEIKLTPADKWQFEVGKNLGELFAPIIGAINIEEGSTDFSSISPASIKLNLKKINDLTLSAPADFPGEILEKLRAFSAINEQEISSDPQGLQNLFGKFMDFLQSISPDTLK